MLDKSGESMTPLHQGHTVGGDNGTKQSSFSLLTVRPDHIRTPEDGQDGTHSIQTDGTLGVIMPHTHTHTPSQPDHYNHWLRPPAVNRGTLSHLLYMDDIWMTSRCMPRVSGTLTTPLVSVRATSGHNGAQGVYLKDGSQGRGDTSGSRELVGRNSWKHHGRTEPCLARTITQNEEVAVMRMSYEWLKRLHAWL